MQGGDIAEATLLPLRGERDTTALQAPPRKQRAGALGAAEEGTEVAGWHESSREREGEREVRNPLGFLRGTSESRGGDSIHHQRDESGRGLPERRVGSPEEREGASSREEQLRLR